MCSPWFYFIRVFLSSKYQLKVIATGKVLQLLHACSYVSCNVFQTLRSPRISRERSDTTYALNYLYTRPLHSLYTVSLRSLIIIRISANHSGYTSATRHKLLYFDAYLCIILCILVTPTQRSTCAEESSRACSEICRGIRMRRRFFFLRKNPFSRCDHRICISRKRVILSGTARLSRFIVLRESVKMTVATCYF